MLLGVAGTTGGMIWALRERKAAQAHAAHATTQAERSDQVAHFLEDMLEGVAPGVALGRDTTMLREIVDKTSERIDRELEGQPEVQAELRLTLANVYYELQLYRETERVARHALEAAQAHIGEENIWVADSLQQRGRALTHLREFDEAESSLRRAVAMERQLRGQDSEREATALCSLSGVLRLQAEIRIDPPGNSPKRKQRLGRVWPFAENSWATNTILQGGRWSCSHSRFNRSTSIASPRPPFAKRIRYA